MLLTGKRQNKGFLLLEVMVSATILSVGIVLILNSFITSTRAIELSQDYFRAGLLLEEKLCDVYNTEIKEGSSEDAFSDFNSKFSWYMDVVKPQDDIIDEVSLRVSWRQGTREHDLSILTYL